MKLSDKTCKAAKTKETPYKLFDGGGLFLEVMPNGSKLWRLKYRFLGKEKRISLGAYPIVSLADAPCLNVKRCYLPPNEKFFNLYARASYVYALFGVYDVCMRV